MGWLEYRENVWKQRPWQIKANGLSFIDILAHLIFGGVLFSNVDGLVDLAAIDAFLAYHNHKENPVVAMPSKVDTVGPGWGKSTSAL